MKFRLVFLEEFGKAFVPRKIRPILRRYLLKANISPIPYNFFGALFYLTALFTAVIYIFFIYPFLSQYSSFVILVFSFSSWFIIQILFAVFFIMVIHFYLDMKIYYRTRALEEMLPDFLQVVSSNLKAGMSFENSLWAGIKPRFKLLANEMAEVSKKVMTGYDVDKALIELSDKYNSPMLKRAVDLIITELETGSNIAPLIDKVVTNMRATRVLKGDMAANALSYIIFISAIVILIAPLLFSLSFSLLIVISSFSGQLAETTDRVSANMPFQISGVSVDLDIFKSFSIAALIVISFFSSLIVSIVEKGDAKAGIKYIPLYMIGSTVFYFVFMKILDFFFSGLYTGI